MGPSGYAEAGATPLRALLYRHPGLHPMDLLAVWLVPPPKELQDGFGPKLRNALVMSTQVGHGRAVQKDSIQQPPYGFRGTACPLCTSPCVTGISKQKGRGLMQRASLH